MLIFKRKGYYQVEYFDEVLQKLRRKSLKTKNKNEAMKRLTDFGESLDQIKKAPPITISKFREEYLLYIKQTGSKKYLSSVELSFRKFFDYLAKDIFLIDIDMITMEKFLLSVFTHSKYAAHLYLRTLKAAMSKAITWGYVQSNPIKGIKLPKIPTKHPAFISEKELNSIIECIAMVDVKEIVITAFYTGMRMSEILNIRWFAINFTSDIITVQNSENFTTKNKHERVIPMHTKVRDILLRRHNNSSVYIFAKNGILYRQEYISHNFKKTIRKLGLSESLHFHSLRHSFASNLVQKGVSLYVVKELLGHESITTTQIYSHLQNDSLINAIKLL